VRKCRVSGHHDAAVGVVVVVVVVVMPAQCCENTTSTMPASGLPTRWPPMKCPTCEPASE
jgi:hypothetical protein